MKIIITGGTGLIGRAVVSDLATDHEIIILSRRPQAHRENLPSNVRVESWDGRSAAGWGPFVDGADAVINLAGESIAGEGFPPARWTPERKQRILESRVNAGKAVLTAIEAAQNKPRVLIQASAVGYYGPQGDEVILETDPPGGDFLADVCKAWEASTAPAEAWGIRRVILRTGVVLSMEGGAFPRLLIPFKMFAGGPLGDGKQFMPWIHMEDEVRAIRFLLEDSSASGPFNLTAPKPVTNAEMAAIVGRVMGRPAFVPAPAFALRAMMGEVATVVLDGQQAVPEALRRAGFTFNYPDAEDAVRSLLG